MVHALKNEEGQWISDATQLKLLALNYFKGLYTATTPNQGQLQTNFPLLSQFEIDELAKPIEKEDIKTAVFSMGPYKSLGIPYFEY